jgi:hypothetical protein
MKMQNRYKSSVILDITDHLNYNNVIVNLKWNQKDSSKSI